MKIDFGQNVAQVIGGGEISEFKVSHNSKIFKMFSDSVYTDKILAVIRELSSNAYDAHVENGNKERPFEINFPTSLNLVFSIRDFGLGLSEEDLRNIYTVYGASTKSNSNEYIGAFGIGAKSPFAYTETFTVISRHNSLKETYTAYVGENGVPKLVKVSSQKTDEDSGLEIILPVKHGDISTFLDRGQLALQCFNPFPIVTPNSLRITPAKYIIRENDWGIRDGHTSISKFRIIQSNVAYEIDFKNCPKNVDWFVPNGEFTPSLSREDIAWDKENVSHKKLEANIERIKKEIRLFLKDRFKQLSLKQILEEWDAIYASTIDSIELDYITIGPANYISLTKSPFKLYYATPRKGKAQPQSAIYINLLKDKVLIKIPADDFSWYYKHLAWLTKERRSRYDYIYVSGDTSQLTGLDTLDITDCMTKPSKRVKTDGESRKVYEYDSYFNRFKLYTLDKLEKGYFLPTKNGKISACLKKLSHWYLFVKKAPLKIYKGPRKITKDLTNLEELYKEYLEWLKSKEFSILIRRARLYFADKYLQDVESLDRININPSSPFYEACREFKLHEEAKALLKNIEYPIQNHPKVIDANLCKILENYEFFIASSYNSAFAQKGAREVLEAFDKSRGVVYYP